MAIINFTGFETGDSTESVGASGVSYVTTPVKTGTYVLKILPISSTATAFYQFRGINADGSAGDNSTSTMYFSFSFRYATKAGSGAEEIYQDDNGSSPAYSIRLNSSGNLAVYDSALSLVATGATALTANTWYHISGRFTKGAGTGTYLVNIDGTQELTGTAQQFGSATFSRVVLGKVTNRSSQSIEYYYDNLILDSTTEPSRDMVAAILHPNGDGSTQQWVSGTGPSYTEVSETVPNTATYVQSSGSANQRAWFYIESRASRGIPNATYPAIKHMRLVGKVTGTDTSAFSSELNNGVATNTTTSNNPTGIQLLSKLVTTYTQNDLVANNIQAGGKETNAVAMRMYWVGVGILYQTTGVSPSSSISPSSSVSASPSPSSSVSPSPSVSPSSSISASISPSSSPSRSLSPSASVSPSSSISSSSSPSQSDSASISPSSSVSPSASTSRSQSPSASKSPSSSISASYSPSSSSSASVSPSESGSPSPSSSISPSPSPQFSPPVSEVSATKQSDSLTITDPGDINLIIID